MNMEFLKQIYFRLPVIVRLLLTILIVMTLFGTVIHLLEPNQFPSIFMGVWWAFVTGATVGYGDVVPLTTAGRIIGILLILSGGGLLTFYITQVSATTIKHEQELSKGNVAFKGTNHIILIGWNERTRQLVHLIHTSTANTEIVLIDASLNNLSFKNVPVHFIHGDASEDETLKKANIKQATHVVISADHTTNEQRSDNRTILIAVAIRGNNRDIPIIAEILSRNQFDNAKRAGATTLIRSNDFMSVLLYHELFNRQTIEPYDTLMHLLISQQFEHIPIPEHLIDKPYRQTIDYFLQKHKIVIGLIRNNDWQINPSFDEHLEAHDTIILLANNEHS